MTRFGIGVFVFLALSASAAHVSAQAAGGGAPGGGAGGAGAGRGGGGGRAGAPTTPQPPVFSPGTVSTGQNQLTAQQRNEGWISLFDGQTLNGWVSQGMARWTPENGVLTPIPGTGGGHLATSQSFGDFRLVVEVWADSLPNSGIYLRGPATEELNVNNAWEVQVFDNGPVWQTGAIVDLAAASEKIPTTRKWSTIDITARGHHFVVLVNGTKVLDATAVMPRLTSGPWGFGAVSGEIHFRNIRILRL